MALRRGVCCSARRRLCATGTPAPAVHFSIVCCMLDVAHSSGSARSAGCVCRLTLGCVCAARRRHGVWRRHDRDRPQGVHEHDTSTGTRQRVVYAERGRCGPAALWSPGWLRHDRALLTSGLSLAPVLCCLSRMVIVFMSRARHGITHVRECAMWQTLNVHV